MPKWMCVSAGHMALRAQSVVCRLPTQRAARMRRDAEFVAVAPGKSLPDC